MASKEFLDSLKPMMDCPRWRWCWAPICPLDPKMPKRGKAIDGARPTGLAATGGVKEPECRLPKAKRMELGKNLPWRGLWPRELATTEHWEGMTPEQRATALEKLAQSREESPIAHGSQR